MATQLFNWGCESGTLANYFNGSVHAASNLSTTKAHGGTKSILFDPSLSTAGDLVTETPVNFTGSGGDFAIWPSAKPTIYFSFWQYMDPLIAPGGAGAHAWRLKSKATTFGLDLQQPSAGQPSGGHYEWNCAVFDNSGGGVVDYGIFPLYTIPVDQWTKVEVLCTLNTLGVADGVLKVWVDGSLQYNSTTQILRSSASTNVGWDRLSLNTNYDPGGAHGWWLDDIKIWDGLPTGDTTDPVCTITTPTSSPTYSTADPALVIAGTASDDTAVTSVTWSNDRGGSGTAGGTTSWSFVPTLSVGVNVITVSAFDAAGNDGTDVITITYVPASSLIVPRSSMRTWHR